MRILGYAVFLDIMGFSSIIAGEQQQERIQAYVQCLRDSLDANGAIAMEYVVFSDSIVITTADDSEASLQALLARCSSLFGALLANSTPVRGAIAHGTYVREKSPSGSFVAGRAIIEAYRFEAKQDWIGIMLAPTVIQRVPDMGDRCSTSQYPNTPQFMKELISRLSWAAFVQPNEAIPFHGEPTEDTNFFGFAVVPSTGVAEFSALRDSLTRSTAILWNLRLLAPDPKTQRKYLRSIHWLTRVENVWRQAVHLRDEVGIKPID